MILQKRPAKIPGSKSGNLLRVYAAITVHHTSVSACMYETSYHADYNDGRSDRG